jgi:hypothetical protein
LQAFMFRSYLLFAVVIIVSAAAACREEPDEPGRAYPTSLKQVAAANLNYRYEADVPAPPPSPIASSDERHAAVQADFDRNRPMEILARTIVSPDSRRVLAVYSSVSDVPSEFRLDMYSPDGRLLAKVTPDTMAVHFQETITWAPDSSAVAFVAMLRAVQLEGQPAPSPTPAETETSPTPDGESAEEPTPAADATAESAATPSAPAGVLTFRTEQIYICDAEGRGLKPLTQNEGLIYFYYVWAPDGSMLAALAATAREWAFLNQRAELNAEIFVPLGRPRLVEKNGRERRLDDALTAVRPVWSPDSSKVAGAFDKQVRIYDAAGGSPTQAAILLRNHLLLSSQAYDMKQQRDLGGESADGNSAASPTPPPATLPDENSLVSFNPITELNWHTDDQLYFQTAFIKRMKNEADSVTSFTRWHRLIFSPQPVSPAR